MGFRVSAAVGCGTRSSLAMRYSRASKVGELVTRPVRWDRFALWSFKLILSRCRTAYIAVPPVARGLP